MSKTPDEVAREIMREYRINGLFAAQMRYEKSANAYKGGWLGRSKRQHFRDIDYHCAKLKAAVRSGDAVRVLEFSADVGNHAMFIADQFYGFLPDTLAARPDAPPHPGRGFYLRLCFGSPRWIPTLVWKALKRAWYEDGQAETGGYDY